jgi:hypothetical protein
MMKVTLPATTVTLIAPGLTDPGSMSAAAPSEQAISAPALAAWPELIWQSCERLPWETVVIRALGYSTCAAGAVPAMQSYRSGGKPNKLPDTTADVPPPAAVGAVCADPVHLQADLDDAVLLPPEALHLSMEEAFSLQHSINELLISDGLHMQTDRDNPCRWMLSGFKTEQAAVAELDPAILDTWPTHAVARRNVTQYLPGGECLAGWRRLMTELQMLLHNHPVNEQRLQRGQLIVNGVWMWGGAALPETTTANAVRLVAADVDVTGLARALGIKPDSEERDLATTLTEARLAGESILIVDLGFYNAWLAGDSEAMQVARSAIEANWLIPVKSAVKARKVSRFVMDNAEGYQAVAISKPRRFSLLSHWLRPLMS